MTVTSHMPAWLSAESYWVPEHIVDSAWLTHGAFAFWLVAAIEPRSIAELGTHNGFSYFAFCEGVRRLGLSTRCYALDSWEGDIHAGFYGEQIYELVSTVNEEKYSDFSTLIRGYFDDAVDGFDDGSLDLLHIDGRHRYDDVKHDFETWLPKLSERGVVLFHDLAERENDFGVWRLWAEVKDRYPSFTFEHGHGLGVLAVGGEVPEALRPFIDADEATTASIRDSYSALGGRIFGLYSLLAQNDALRREIEISTEQFARRTAEFESLLGSFAWRSTAPLRWATKRIPLRIRRALRP